VRVRVQAIDLNMQSQDQEVQKADVQGVHPKCNFTSEPYSNDELLVLCTTYQECFETLGPSSTNEFIYNMYTILVHSKHFFIDVEEREQEIAH